MTSRARRDPRRVGIGAACLVGAYGIVIFIDESTVFRLTFGAILTAVSLTFAALVPLPAWRERDSSKIVAGWGMVAEAVVIAVIITLVRLARGS